MGQADRHRRRSAGGGSRGVRAAQVGPPAPGRDRDFAGDAGRGGGRRAARARHLGSAGRARGTDRTRRRVAGERRQPDDLGGRRCACGGRPRRAAQGRGTPAASGVLQRRRQGRDLRPASSVHGYAGLRARPAPGPPRGVRPGVRGGQPPVPARRAQRPAGAAARHRPAGDRPQQPEHGGDDGRRARHPGGALRAAGRSDPGAAQPPGGTGGALGGTVRPHPPAGAAAVVHARDPDRHPRRRDHRPGVHPARLLQPPLLSDLRTAFVHHPLLLRYAGLRLSHRPGGQGRAAGQGGGGDLGRRRLHVQRTGAGHRRPLRDQRGGGRVQRQRVRQRAARSAHPLQTGAPTARSCPTPTS